MTMTAPEYQDHLRAEARAIVERLTQEPAMHPALVTREGFAREAAYRALLAERVIVDQEDS